MATDDGRLACITLDVEPDFTAYSADLSSPRYYGLFDEPGQFERFCDLMARHSVKLTCFVVGTVLQDRPDHIRELQRRGAEFGSHSLTHRLDAQGDEREIRGGIEAFADFFGYLPQGYRAPVFALQPITLEVLEREGVRYDSSYLPSIRPGVCWNIEGPVHPFRWQGSGLVELPMSVAPVARIPIGLSYVKVLGRLPFIALERLLGFPDPLVTFFHPMNIVYSPQAFEQLPLRWKLANSRNRWRGLEMLEWFLLFLRRRGYGFASMGQLFELVCTEELREVSPRVLPGVAREAAPPSRRTVERGAL